MNFKILRKVESIVWIFILATIVYCIILEKKDIKYDKYFKVPIQNEYSYFSEIEKIVIVESESKDERVYNLRYNISPCTDILLNNIPGIYTSLGIKSKIYITKSKAVEWKKLDSKIIEILIMKGCEDESINKYFEHFNSFIIDDSMFKNNI